MDFEYTIHEYPDSVNISAEFKDIKKTEMSELIRRMRTAGIDIRYHTHTDFPGLSDIIERSIETGELTCSYGDGVTRCLKCGRGGQYPLYKAGPNKGKQNYDKPMNYPQGITFNRGFISFRNSANYCHSCHEEFKIIDMAISIILEKDLPVEIQIRGHEEKTRYIKDQQRKCFSCGNTMYETEMNRSHRLMDSSTYPAQCPHCKAVAMMFGKSHSTEKGFRMLTVADYLEKVKLLKVCFDLQNGAWRYSNVTIKNNRVW